MRAIDRIKKAALEAPSTFLDNPIHTEQELELSDFYDHNTMKEEDIDIPVSNVIALFHRNFAKQDDSWRVGVQRLIGETWEDDVFHYFESEIRNTKFPPADSRDSLRVTAYGGALLCGNGNHRLLAAMAWMAHKYGDNAYLKQVRVTRYGLKKTIKRLFEEVAQYDIDVAYYQMTDNERFHGFNTYSNFTGIFKTKGIEKTQLFGFVDDNLVEIEPVKQPWFKKLLGQKLPCLYTTICDEVKFNDIPNEVVTALVDDGWINQSLKRHKQRNEAKEIFARKVSHTKDLLQGNIVEDTELQQDVTLHHYGLFDASQNELDRPIWVSPLHETSVDYKSFSHPATHYTTAICSKALKLADLKYVSLFSLYKEVKAKGHNEWNLLLAAALQELGYDGITYQKQEVMLCDPANALASVASIEL
ncbi:hypothetical protein [Vibrio lentus]|uniref:hypothetical protein n=1 Tax=Vibrio lentus TaxID=136468 RepID=UPI00247AD4C1|nr:hypothetical protein [Vibrio lentus]WGS60200.1 hypothetical protein ISX51_13055 [Vibrio lentus]